MNEAHSKLDYWKSRPENRANVSRGAGLAISSMAAFDEIGVLRVDYGDGIETNWHEHEGDSCHLVLGGTVREDYQSVQRVGRPGTLLFYEKNVQHRSVVANKSSKMIHFPVWDDLPYKIRSGALIDAGLIAHLLFLPAVRLLIDSVESQFSAAKARNSAAKMNSELKLARSNWHEISRFDIRRLNGRLTKCASQSGLSRGHFARQFRKFFGQSVGQFIRRSRVSLSIQRLIETPDRPLVEAAHFCGFSDQSHMCREFRRELSITPSRFIKLLESL